MCSVASDFDAFEAIEKRREDGIEGVGCADEEHPRQIDLNVHEIVFEAMILNWVEHLHDSILKA